MASVDVKKSIDSGSIGFFTWVCRMGVFGVSIDYRQGVSNHFKIIITYFSMEDEFRDFLSFAKQGFIAPGAHLCTRKRLGTP